MNSYRHRDLSPASHQMLLTAEVWSTHLSASSCFYVILCLDPFVWLWYQYPDLHCASSPNPMHTNTHIHTSSVKGSLTMATVNESNLKEPPVSGGCWGCLHCWREDLATCNHKPSIQALFSITQQVRIYCIMASVLFNPDWHIGMR